MRKIKQVHLVCEKYSDDYDEEVNKYINKGWELHGKFKLGVDDHYNFYCQQMVIYEEEKKASGGVLCG